MKILYLLSFLAASEAFSPGAPSSQPRRRPAATTKTATATELRMGWMDDMFKPVHGHGSGEKQLDQIYREEQAVLKDRKEHYNKNEMKKKYKKKQGSFLEDFFSNPFHGQGSDHDERDYDEMYRAQQQVLYERREYLGNKDKLRKKYSRIGEDHIKDIPLHPHDPKRLNQKEDDAMYVDEGAPTFEIPFFKKKNQLKP